MAWLPAAKACVFASHFHDQKNNKPETSLNNAYEETELGGSRRFWLSGRWQRITTGVSEMKKSKNIRWAMSMEAPYDEYSVGNGIIFYKSTMDGYCSQKLIPFEWQCKIRRKKKHISRVEFENWTHVMVSLPCLCQSLQTNGPIISYPHRIKLQRHPMTIHP